jgi:hypothetical protein
MGRNQDLRKKIAGCRRVIEVHKEKISAELMKPHPSDTLIARWHDPERPFDRSWALDCVRQVRAWAESVLREQKEGPFEGAWLTLPAKKWEL